MFNTQLFENYLWFDNREGNIITTNRRNLFPHLSFIFEIYQTNRDHLLLQLMFSAKST